MMKRHTKGMALFLTLTILVCVLAVMAVFHAQGHFALKNGLTSNEHVSLRHIASSGINAGMGVLLIDKFDNQQDSLTDIWADGDALWDMAGMLNFKDGRCLITIYDLKGKVQINALAKQPGTNNDFVIARILETIIEDNLEEYIPPGYTAKDIVENIRAYINSNAAKPNFINDPRELLQVGGITKELLFGEINFDKDFNFANTWKKTTTVNYAPGYGKKLGLAGYITVFGLTFEHGEYFYDGRVNINTAPKEVLFALFPKFDEPVIDTIYRRMLGSVYNTITDKIDFNRPDWFEHEALLLGHADYPVPQGVVATVSDWFEICAIGISKTGYEKRIRAVVKRELNGNGNWTCKIYEWEETAVVPVSHELSELLKQNTPKPKKPQPFSTIRANKG